MRIFKLLARIATSTDVLMGMLVFSITTWAFYLAGAAIPEGFGLVIAVAVTLFFAVGPDWDMIPYLIIRKGNPEILLIRGSILLYGSIALSFFDLPLWAWSVWVLSLFSGFGLMVAYSVTSIVNNRASHWPIWHHLIPYAASVVLIVFLEASLWVPEQTGYYLVLTMTVTMMHFIHDGIQAQGFPYLSPCSSRHYRLEWFRVVAIPAEETWDHYERQALRAVSNDRTREIESRSKPVTATRIMLFAVALGITVATIVSYA